MGHQVRGAGVHLYVSAGGAEQEGSAERRVGLAVALLVFCVAAYFVPGATWSPVSRFSLTRAIVERGTFEITPDAASTRDRAQVGERFYSDKAPLPAFLAVPAYAAFHVVSSAVGSVPAFRTKDLPGRSVPVVLPNAAFQRGLYVCTVSTAGVAAAALAWALFGVLRRRTSVRVAALSSALTVLATPLFPYAASFFDHTIAAACLFGAFACVDAGRAGTRRFALAGMLLGVAVGTEYVVAVPATAVAAYVVLIAGAEHRGTTLAWVALGAAVPLSVVAVYHTICFGAPYRTGYSFITHPGFAVGQSSGLFGLTRPRLEAVIGLLASPSRGLFYVAPLTLLAVFELWRGAKRTRDPALYLGLVVLFIAYAVNTTYFQWDGGRAFGPRHMVPALGFLGFGIAFALERHPSLTPVVAGISAFIVLGTTAVMLEAPRDDVIFGYLVPALRQGRIARAPGASNLGLLLGLGAHGSLVALAAVVGAGALVTSRLVARCAGEGPEGGEPQ
jgi:hypothetical protein